MASSRDARLLFFLVIPALVIGACAASPGRDAEATQAGARLYAANCQACHGEAVTGAGSIAPAPSHGPEGHTWHQADGQLVDIVLGALDYPKSSWSDEQRSFQEETSRNWEATEWRIRPGASARSASSPTAALGTWTRCARWASTTSRPGWWPHGNHGFIEAQVPVEVSGVLVNPGDLIHADVNGVIIIPRQVVPQVIEEAREVRRREAEVMARVSSDDFTVDSLRSR